MTMHDNSHWTENQQIPNLFEPQRITANDIYETTPQAKFIVIMRNPTDRLYSHYNMFKGSAGSPERFHQQAMASIEWWQNCTEKKALPERRCLYGSPSELPPMPLTVGNPNVWWSKTNYSEGIRIGMYAVYIQDWLKVFPRSSFAFVKHEEYAINKTHVMNEHVLPMLGLKSYTARQLRFIQVSETRNKGTYHAEILPETRKMLDEFYAPFNERLARILGDTKWLWKD